MEDGLPSLRHGHLADWLRAFSIGEFRRNLGRDYDRVKEGGKDLDLPAVHQQN
jgi:hypothetical protein